MRYLIGIDLGTTNSCVAYVDMQGSQQIQLLKIPQMNAQGSLEALSMLPSFYYLGEPSCVGAYAQSLGSRIPTKLVHSAKSWLCHSAAARQGKILPLEGSVKISPVEASQRYLLQLREAWNKQIAKGDPELEFEQQDIVLTVPASFDEIARNLSVEAARLAGITHLTLLEEPQAAFYSWLAQHEKEWKSKLEIGDAILVCDVGGGTTDFSMIEVKEQSLNRMMVGDHLLLGGDNMDAALTHLLEKKLEKELEPHQFQQLLHEARKIKETLLSGKQEHCEFVLQGSGSKVIQGAIGGSISKQEVLNCLLEGFFGNYSWEEASHLKPSRGIRTMGLPYEDEPSIVKHLAFFLKRQPLKPKRILFNGGVLKPKIFRERILDNLQSWYPDSSIEEIESVSLDLAVARGAAYYGKVRKGLGVRIGGGSARAYYLEVGMEGQEVQALTLLPRGSEDGAVFVPEQVFNLIPNTPVAFTLYTSHTRLHDQPGDLVSIDQEEMYKLPSIATLLKFGKTSHPIPVNLQVGLTALGTIDIRLKSLSTPHQWSLEFQIRAVAGQENILTGKEAPLADEMLDSEVIEAAKVLIAQFFSNPGSFPSAKLVEKLEQILDKPRKEWPLGALRAFWGELLRQAPKRKASSEIVCRWWNLTGFCLRPGYGYPLDDHRIKDLWKIILGELNANTQQDVFIQQLICFRRIAGGLNKGQQLQIANLHVPLVLNRKNSKMPNRNKAEGYTLGEQIRMLGAFEYLDIPLKVRLGELLLDRIASKEASSADFWALGRIGARHLAYGSIVNVIPKETCCKWIERLLDLNLNHGEDETFTFGMLTRKTEYRDFQVPTQLVQQVLDKCKGNPGWERLKRWVFEDLQLTQGEQEVIFGDRLPPGLILRLN